MKAVAEGSGRKRKKGKVIQEKIMLRNNMMGGAAPDASGATGGNDWYYSSQTQSGPNTAGHSSYNYNPYAGTAAPQSGSYGSSYPQQPSYDGNAPIRYRGGVNDNSGSGNQDAYTNQHMDDDMDFKNKGMYGVDEDYANEPPLLEELGIHFDHIWLKTLSVVYPFKDLGQLSLVSKMSFNGFTKFVLSGGKSGPDSFSVPSINTSITVTSKELDSDLTGPILYCLLLGLFMLLAGKANFGYIYGFSVTCSLLLHQVLLLLQVRTGYGGGSAGNDNSATSPSKMHQHGLGAVAADGSELSIWETCSVLGYSLIPVVLLSAVSIILSLKGVVGTILSIGAIYWSTYSATRLFDVKMFLRQNNQFWLVAYPVALFYACFTLITVF